MHTDPTLEILDATTISLGQQFRVFVNTTCSAFDTRELNREANACKWWEAKKPGKMNTTTTMT
jgi:hypothetical protein